MIVEVSPLTFRDGALTPHDLCEAAGRDMPRLLLLTLALLATLPTTAPAGLVISQYYEGAANNKWIELFNSGASAVQLSNYSIGMWEDTNAESYKTGAAPTTTAKLPVFSLPSGGVYLLSHGEAGIPLDLTANYLNSTVVTFDGNDSFAIYTSGSYSTSALVDAIGFTNSGKEGANKGFVRVSLAPGYNLLSGSDVTDFSSVWKAITVTNANTPNGNVDYTLGSTSLSAVPEPTAALVGGLVASVLSLTVARRPAQRG